MKLNLPNVDLSNFNVSVYNLICTASHNNLTVWSTIDVYVFKCSNENCTQCLSILDDWSEGNCTKCKPGYQLNSDSITCDVTCGGGNINSETFEECDDHNLNEEDGCDSYC